MHKKVEDSIEFTERHRTLKHGESAYIAYHSSYRLPLPEGHRYPMLKYELIPEQLLYEGVIAEEDIFEPDFLDTRYLIPVHDEEYVKRVLSLNLNRKEVRRIGLPVNDALIERELRLAQGTIDGAEIAMHTGIAFNCAGGTHHAGSNWGEGFCILNDQAIAAHYLLETYNMGKILIIDLDVHQGNGTAEIYNDEPRVFTFSMHGAKNFPFRKEKSDLDIGLADGTKGEEYLEILDKNLNDLFDRLEPDFVFYQAGADVLESDKLGRLKLSKEDCISRDTLVFNYCQKNNVPVEVCMGGGYSPRIADIVDVHCNTFKTGISLFNNINTWN